MTTITYRHQSFIINSIFILWISLLFQACAGNVGETICDLFPNSEQCQERSLPTAVEDGYIPISIQLFDADTDNLERIPQPQNINIRIYDPNKALITASGIPVVNYRDTSDLLPKNEGILHTQKGIINLRLPKKLVVFSENKRIQPYSFTININEANYFELTEIIHITSEQPLYKALYLLREEKETFEVGTFKDFFIYQDLIFIDGLYGVATGGIEDNGNLSAGLEIAKGIKITKLLPIIEIPYGGYNPPFANRMNPPRQFKGDLFKGIDIPRSYKFSEKVQLPEGVRLAEGTMLPEEVILPENIVLPRGTLLKKGTYIPSTAVLPYGVDLRLGQKLTQDVVLNENLFRKKNAYSTINSRNSAPKGLLKINVFDTQVKNREQESYPINLNVLPGINLVTDAVKNQEPVATLEDPFFWDVLAYVDYDLVTADGTVKELSDPANGFVEIKKEDNRVKEGDVLEVWSQDSKTGQWQFEQNATVLSSGNEGKRRINFKVKHFSRYILVISDGDRIQLCEATINIDLDNVGKPNRSHFFRIQSSNGPHPFILDGGLRGGTTPSILDIPQNIVHNISFVSLPNSSNTSLQIFEGTAPNTDYLINENLDCNDLDLDLPFLPGMCCEYIAIEFLCGSVTYIPIGITLNYLDDNSSVPKNVDFFENGEPATMGFIGVQEDDILTFSMNFDNSNHFSFQTEVEEFQSDCLITENVNMFGDATPTAGSFSSNSIPQPNRLTTPSDFTKSAFCKKVTTFRFGITNSGCTTLAAIASADGGVMVKVP